MAALRNEHWRDAKHTAAVPDWASYTVFKFFPPEPLTERQRYAIDSFLGISVDSGVKAREVRAGPEIGQVTLGMIVEGKDRDEALENAMRASVGAMASADIDLELTFPGDVGIVPKLQLDYGNRDNPLVAADPRYRAPIKNVGDAYYDAVESHTELERDLLSLAA